jgi:hypothetical protein
MSEQAILGMRANNQEPPAPLFPDEVLRQSVGEHEPRRSNMNHVAPAVLLTRPIIDGANVEELAQVLEPPHVDSYSAVTALRGMRRISCIARTATGGGFPARIITAPARDLPSRVLVDPLCDIGRSAQDALGERTVPIVFKVPFLTQTRL